MRLSRLAFTSNAKTLIPVTLPPGFARFAMRPSATGSSPTPNTIGIVAVAAFAATAGGQRQSNPRNTYGWDVDLSAPRPASPRPPLQASKGGKNVLDFSDISLCGANVIHPLRPRFLQRLGRIVDSFKSNPNRSQTFSAQD